MDPELTTLAQSASPTPVTLMAAEWQGRIRRLLAGHPEAAVPLRDLLDELPPCAAPAPAVSQHATASGESKIHQAGRDLRITERITDQLTER